MPKRTFLITGATEGIGVALARRLARAGHSVVGVAPRSAEFPGKLVTVDLAHRKRTQAVLERLAGRYAFDGVINNLDRGLWQRLAQVERRGSDEAPSVNPHLAIQAVQALLPGMLSRGWGRIVNILSLTIIGAIERAAFAGNEVTMLSFRSCALELAGRGITINCISPGPTDTGLLGRDSPSCSADRGHHGTAVPTRGFARPNEITAGVQFLLSENAGSITGQTLFIDGGAWIGQGLL